MQHGFVTELETGAVLALAIGKKHRRREEGNISTSQAILCVSNRHPFYVLPLVGVCGGDGGLPTRAQATYQTARAFQSH